MEQPFYSGGLRFSCTNCSNCCRHDPGYVFMTYDDLHALASALDMTDREFYQTYCRIIDINGFKRVSLKEKSNYDCIFWKDGCTLYEHRPMQCRSYPFWTPFLASRETWDSLRGSCPGVNYGQLHSQREIDEWIELRNRSTFLTDRDAERFG